MKAPTEDTAGMVRHEEHLHVHIETIPREVVHVEKVIVTEQRTLTVEVRREELRITRTPISSNNSPDLLAAPRTRTRPPIVMILREERPVISLAVIPVEKVTVDVRVDTTDHHLSESLHHEHIDVRHPPAT